MRKIIQYSTTCGREFCDVGRQMRLGSNRGEDAATDKVSQERAYKALFRVDGVIKWGIVGGAAPDLASAPALPTKLRPRKEKGAAETCTSGDADLGTVTDAIRVASSGEGQSDASAGQILMVVLSHCFPQESVGRKTDRQRGNQVVVPVGVR